MDIPWERETTPARLAGAYVLGGVAWVLGASYLATTLSPRLAGQIYVVSGTLLVVASGGLLYRVRERGDQQIQRTTTELQQTLQQTHVLHRILRHNLRNHCNVIMGYADQLDPDGTGATSAAAATIRRNADELIEVSEQCRILREVALGERPTTDIDLVTTVEATLATLEEKYPELEYRCDLPETAPVSAHPDVDHAIREVLVNAHEHGAGEIVVHVDTDTDGRRFVEVTDQGSGFPEMERKVLREGFIETQQHHSQGLGLWIVRSLLNASGGSLSVESVDTAETTVRLTFEPTVDAAIEQFLR